MGAAGRDELDAALGEGPGQVEEAGLVGDREEGAGNGGAAGHANIPSSQGVKGPVDTLSAIAAGGQGEHDLPGAPGTLGIGEMDALVKLGTGADDAEAPAPSGRE